MHYGVKLVDTGELKIKVVVEVVMEIAAEIAIEIAAEVAAEVLVELAAGRLGYYLQIWLVVPVV